MRTDEIKNEKDETKNWEYKIKQKDLKYQEGKHKYNFQLEAIRFFGESIYSGKISIHEADMDQTNLLENLKKFNDKSRSKTKEGKDKKQNTIDSVNALYDDRELTLNAFRSGMFPYIIIRKSTSFGLSSRSSYS